MKKTGMLSVPEASLYYEVRGIGPVLLLIHGGNCDADVYAGIAKQLADRYTVITYDRRGYSRSKLINSDEKYQLITHSEDACRLLTELTNEPAYVFGTSAGAIIGLELASRHPEQIKALIAHEPPLTHLLTGEEQAMANQIQEKLELTAQNEGAIPAIKQFASVLGMDKHGQSSNRPSAEQVERIIDNMKFFVKHEAPAIRRHMLDLEGLKTVMKGSAIRIISGCGSDSQVTFPYQCAIALAEQLGIDCVKFSGNHLGYVQYSHEFALQIHKTLKTKNSEV